MPLKMASPSLEQADDGPAFFQILNNFAVQSILLRSSGMELNTFLKLATGPVAIRLWMAFPAYSPRTNGRTIAPT